MSEFLFEWDVCGMDLNLLLVHRLISKGYEASGVRENELTLVSHPMQADMIRALLVGIAQNPETNKELMAVILKDDNLNPFLRVKQWITDKDVPPNEMYIETPKGRGRLFNLMVIGL